MFYEIKRRLVFPSFLGGVISINMIFFVFTQEEIRQAIQDKRKETRANQMNESRFSEKKSALDRFQSRVK